VPYCSLNSVRKGIRYCTILWATYSQYSCQLTPSLQAHYHERSSPRTTHSAAAVPAASAVLPKLQYEAVRAARNPLAPPELATSLTDSCSLAAISIDVPRRRLGRWQLSQMQQHWSRRCSRRGRTCRSGSGSHWCMGCTAGRSKTSWWVAGCMEGGDRCQAADDSSSSRCTASHGASIRMH
jgi:hypothetical protein